DAAIERGQTLAGLDQTREFADIDWQSVVNRAEQLRAEQRELEAVSAELARLNKELRTVEESIAEAESRLREVDGLIGRISERHQGASAVLRDAREILAEPAAEQAKPRFSAIAELLTRAGQPKPEMSGACDRAETAAVYKITVTTEKRGDRLSRLSNKIVAAMGEFRRQYTKEA